MITKLDNLMCVYKDHFLQLVTFILSWNSLLLREELGHLFIEDTDMLLIEEDRMVEFSGDVGEVGAAVVLLLQWMITFYLKEMSIIMSQMRTKFQ